MWAFGRYDLNLSEDGFWSLTLKELSALADRHKANEQWLNYRSAQICYVLANIWRGKNSKIYKLEDFMPGIERKAQTIPQMEAALKLLNTAYGGDYIENG